MRTKREPKRMRKTKNKVGDVYPKESCIRYITSTQPWTSKQELQDAAEVLGLDTGCL